MTAASAPRGGVDTAIRGATGDWWSDGASRAIQTLADSRRSFTADDLLALVGQPSDPHYVGAAFAAARRSGLIEVVGSKVGSNGRLLRIWWGRSAALKD